MSFVTVVILAAGQSQRMGEAKLLLPWGDTTILGQTIRNVRASTADDILLISGAYRDEVEAIATAHQIRCLYNPSYATGEMLSSLKTAVRALARAEPPVSGIVVMLGDLPFIPPEIIDQVVAAYRAGKGELIAPVYAGRRGHPVLISAAFFPDLLSLPPESAPRDLIRRHEQSLYLLSVDSDIILRDIDTPEQYARWKP